MEEEGIANFREVGGAAGHEASTVRGREGAKTLFETYLLKRKYMRIRNKKGLEAYYDTYTLLRIMNTSLIKFYCHQFNHISD